ncbi:MAG: metallophosphoesterase, partial [Lentisphaeria bacterium]|nr:metallophosphoesterase [Lentisphaeria bacterium]
LLDPENLYLGVYCHDPAGVYKNDNAGVWSNDNMEIFLGNLSYPDWYRQIVIASNGKSYDEAVREGSYRYAVSTAKDHWIVEMAIRRATLGHMKNDSMIFNLLRYRTKAKELLSWTDVRWGHDADHFGTLTFTTPANEITHGPWTLEIRKNSAGIRWETFAKCAGKIFLRKKGSADFKAIPADTLSGVTERFNLIHTAILTGLEEDTVYEYRVPPCEKIRTFRTLSTKEQDFSFGVTSDIHTRSWNLERLLQLPAVRNADLLFFAGDLVSGIIGRGVQYETFLDPVVKFRQDKVSVFMRGNHEYRGGNVESFFEIASLKEKKAYGAFYHKGIYFIYCDADGDEIHNKAYQEAHKRFLLQAVKSPEFKKAAFRVLINHLPFLDNPLGGTPRTRNIFQSIAKEDLAKIDLMLCGHTHYYLKALPEKERVFSLRKTRNNYKQSFRAPFPVLTNDASGCLLVEKHGKILTVKAMDKTGKELDKVTIKAKK